MEKRVIISGLTGFSGLVLLSFSIGKLYGYNPESLDSLEFDLILNREILIKMKIIDFTPIETPKNTIPQENTI